MTSLEAEEIAKSPKGCMDADEETEAEEQVETEALVLGEPEFLRGDANVDGKVDISDALSLARYLYLGSTAPPCLDAADANDDGVADLSDAVVIVSNLFLAGSSGIQAPYPSAGVDPTADSLSCESY